MDFSVFPVSSTNIFPLANSTKGGQLFTEFNVRARESIATPQEVKYMIGPSYVHSKDDFWVQCQTDGTEIFDESNAYISRDTLEITPGRGVINGHYVELLTPIVISLSEANYVAKSSQSEGQVPLTGELSIGIRVIYSTDATMAGCMEAENNDTMMYSGIKIVILPRDLFKLPEDVPYEPDKVTAHIKLADFTYINSIVTNLKNNYPSKCHVMSADRISGLSESADSGNLSIKGLKKEKFYTMSGRGSGDNGSDNKPTWCDSTDSLMIWDSNPELMTSSVKPTVTGGILTHQAEFKIDQDTGKTKLVIPHKQPDGFLKTSSSDKYRYYKNREIELPSASFNLGTAGTVTPEYTRRIKEIAKNVTNLYHMSGGKQVGYIPELDSKLDPDSGVLTRMLPPIQSVWKAGDYILVGQDRTVSELGGSSRPSSTLYAVIPGKVRAIAASDATAAYASAQKNYQRIVNNVASAVDALTAAESDKDKAAELVECAYSSLEQGFVIRSKSENTEYMISEIPKALSAQFDEEHDIDKTIAKLSYDEDAVVNEKSDKDDKDEKYNLTADEKAQLGLAGVAKQQAETLIGDLDAAKEKGQIVADAVTDVYVAINGDTSEGVPSLASSLDEMESEVAQGLSGAVDAASGAAKDVTDAVEGLVGEGDIFTDISWENVCATDPYGKKYLDVDKLANQLKPYLETLKGDSRKAYSDLVETVEHYLEYCEKYAQCLSEYKRWSDQLSGASTSIEGLKNATNVLYEALGALKVAISPPGIELGVFDISSDPTTWEDPSGQYANFDEYAVNEIWEIGDSGEYRGVVGADYFTVRYIISDDEVINYYYLVSEAGPCSYSDPVLLTREISLAESNVVGGFLNVDETELDQGYVYRDDNGNLKLLDYNLLRSGTLAYQLGENFSTSSGIDGSEVQAQLDEYVNMRVAFPNANHIKDTDQSGSDPKVIEINLNLTELTDATESIDIYAIDCRFNTSIYLTILGNANSNTTINIVDCQKIRINNNISGTPIINVVRSNLYYDPSVLNYIKTPRSIPANNASVQPVIQDISFWYERFEETQPNLFVDNMTVTETDANVVAEHESFWDDNASPNDTHLLYGLRSITFSKDATIVGCEMYVKNDTTANIRGEGRSLITSNFTLPQGGGLSYPSACLTRQIKITGTFLSAYVPSGDNVCHMIDTKFTAVSQVNNPYSDKPIDGKIAFVVDTYTMDNISDESAECVSVCLDDQFHVFKGGAL